MKTLSILGIVLFSLLLLCSFPVWLTEEEVFDTGVEMLEQAAIENGDYQLSEFMESVGWAFLFVIFGSIGSIFGLVFSIVGVVVSTKQKKKGEMPLTWHLQELDALKKSGALTENEFEAKKRELLNF